jgi:hypothetical protein
MDPVEELKEHAEHAHDPFDKRVAATMAIIAAALAVVSVLGHLFATEELLLQQKASDQWSYYQAKSIRRYQSEVAKDLFATMGGAKSEKKAEDYSGKAEGYKKDMEEISKDAKEKEQESRLRGHQALCLHIGEIFLEIAIVFASLAILTKRPTLYWTAVGSSAVGVVIGIGTVFVRG